MNVVVWLNGKITGVTFMYEDHLIDHVSFSTFGACREVDLSGTKPFLGKWERRRTFHMVPVTKLPPAFIDAVAWSNQFINKGKAEQRGAPACDDRRTDGGGPGTTVRTVGHGGGEVPPGRVEPEEERRG